VIYWSGCQASQRQYNEAQNRPLTRSDVEFSLNELTKFGLSFVDMLDEANLQIASHGVDAINNSYRIALYYADPESVAFINNFSDMSRMLPIPISIELGSSMELSLPGGSHIDSRPLDDMSVGATGITFRGGYAALVTTGHIRALRARPDVGVWQGNTSTVIGSVMAFRDGPYHGGNPGTTHGDWAIVRLNDAGARMVTNRIRTGERLLPSFGVFAPIGTLVGGTGRHTMNLMGTIDRVNQTWGHATGMTYVAPVGSGIGIEGDSGGTVFRHGWGRFCAISVARHLVWRIPVPWHPTTDLYAYPDKN